VSSDQSNHDSRQGTRAGLDVKAGDDATVILGPLPLAAGQTDQIMASDAPPRRDDDKTVILDPLTWGAAHDQIAVGNIPRQPPGFQPRPHLLRQLNRAGHVAPLVQVVTGRPGVGKTQLAAAYARAKLAGGWRLVAWVNAADAGSLLAGLTAVADAAGLSDGSPPRDTADVGQMVRHRLEADGDRCLLIFEDAEDPDLLRRYVPADGAARVLIVSAGPSMANLGTSVPVDVFSAEEAVALLDGRTGLGDDEGAAAVAAALGYLPLALAQASATMAGRHLGHHSYLERLRALPVQENPSQPDGPPYPHGVAEAVLLSLDAAPAGDRSSVSTGVMEIMAVLSEAGIRREPLHAAGRSGVLARPRRRSRVTAEMVDRALARLVECSLLSISLDGQTVTAHRLVMQVVRDGLARQGRLAAVHRAAASVLDAHAAALAGSPDRAAIRDILEQMTALRDNAAGLAAEADDELAAVLRSLRIWTLYHLNKLGDSAPQAIAVGEPLVADLARVLGADHADTLAVRNSLAAAYRDAGRPAAAIPLYEQNLAACERLLGADHPTTLSSRGSLAAAYAEEGRTARAVALLERTLAGRERVLGPDHPDTLTSRNNLAAAYRDAGWAAKAIPLFEQTLAAREGLLGAYHLSTLTTRHDLANAYQDAGRAAEAITLHEQNLAACEQLVGADDAKTVATRNNLAAAYRDAGRPAASILLYEQNLAACERLLGADHPRTVSTRDNLAAAYREADQPEQEATQGEGAGRHGQEAQPRVSESSR
jgi:tetratricopeptide (TPR) repeat protein